MEDSMTKKERTELGRELYRAKLDQDAIMYDSLLGDQYRKLTIYKVPALQHLNDEIEKINKRVAKVKKQFDAIRDAARNKVMDLEYAYFVTGMHNVCDFVTYYGMNVNGCHENVDNFYLEYLYKDQMSGRIRLTIDRCTDTYVFEIRDNNLFIRKDIDLY